MGLAIIDCFETEEKAQEYINRQNDNLDYVILHEPDYDKKYCWTVNID